ncbi:MAG: transcriptional repressor NrdR [Ruminococcus sp.]|nr:transcriptional repressor NrdR [Ruminococcus sp.]
MRCPFCGDCDTRVLDSRPTDTRIRRRRECGKCGKRFTTYEAIERPLLMVEKRDGSFEQFDRQKLIKGIFNAIKKRPVSIEQVSAMVDKIELFFANNMCSTAKSTDIGSMVMEQLKDIDDVAYIRFSSVYQDFTDVEGFIAAISELNNKDK